MKALARLESFIQDLVERPAWLLTARRLHPLEMAAALTRAMEAAALPLADRVVVPDGYTLQLSPDDFAQFAGVRRTLEREFGEYIMRLAVERGLTLGGAAHVTLAEADSVRTGSIQVVTRFTEESEQPARALRRATAVRDERPEPGPTEYVLARRDAFAPAADGTAILEELDDAGNVIRRHPLPTTSLLIGRRASSGLALADPEVSRRHARIDYLAPRYYVRDLESTNGTIVNGRRVRGPHPLADGDMIELGHSRLRFRRGG